MCLSDKNDKGFDDEGFRPLFVGNVLPEEVADSSCEDAKKKAAEIFRALYDRSGEPDEDDSFKALYKSEDFKESEDDSFDPLYSRDEPEPVNTETFPEKEVEGPAEEVEAGPVDGSAPAEEPDLPDDGQASMGWEEGFSKGEKDGYEKGHAEGREKGYEEGFAKGREEGYGAGVESGEKDGAAKAAEAAAEQVTHLEKVLTGLGNLWDDMISRNEDKIIALIARAAGKVVAGMVEIDDDIVRRTILEALKTMPEVEEVSIGVSPEDYEYVETVKEDFFKEFAELQRVSVMANPAVPRGGCKVESKAGEVNSSLEKRLDAVTRSLMEACK